MLLGHSPAPLAKKGNHLGVTTALDRPRPTLDSFEARATPLTVNAPDLGALAQSYPVLDEPRKLNGKMKKSPPLNPLQK